MVTANKNPLLLLTILGALLGGAVLPALVAMTVATPAMAQNLIPTVGTRHYQTCQDNDAGAGEELCAFASVQWSAGVLILGDGSFISESTGATWVDMTVNGQLILDGTPAEASNGEPTVKPGSGAAVEFINGDEDFPDGCPDVAPCAPVYAAGDDCVVRTTDSNSTTTELNSNVAGDAEDVIASFRLTDFFGPPAFSGDLELTENFVPANQQTDQWTSGSIAVLVPSQASELIVEVSFDNVSTCDARLAPIAPATVGPSIALGWEGEVNDVAVFQTHGLTPVGDASHYQACQENDPDNDPSTLPTGTLCAYARVEWSFIALTMGDGAFLTEATGVTWLAFSIDGQMISDGQPTPDDNGNPIAYPGSGAAIEFLSGDEDFPDGCPDVAPCTPTYASSGAADDCIVRTTDSNSTVTELNSNVATDTEDVEGFYAIIDATNSTPLTGRLEVVENFVPANQQTPHWTSGTLIVVPSVAGRVTVEVAFRSNSACDAKDAPVGTATIGADHPVRWDGEVSDVTVFDMANGGGCTASDLRVSGSLGAHAPDFDGTTTITLAVGQHRALVNHTLEVPPEAEVSHQDQDGVHQWTVAAKAPGPNDIHFEAKTSCVLPFRGSDENLERSYTQWTSYKCAKTAVPSTGLSLNIGFATMPVLDPGDSYNGGLVTHVDDTLSFASVAVPTSTPGAFMEDTDADSNVVYCEPDQSFQPSYTPNDPQYGQQYGPGRVRAPQAWDTTLGDTDKTLCVVDSGYRSTHEDLGGARFLGGYDFIDADTTPNDVHGHGTHVSGIAAATTDNSLGVAGIGQVGVKEVKVFNASGGGATDGVVASAIRWCADNGGNVINLSLGRPGTAGDSATMLNAVNYAWNAGSLLVAAAGNDNAPVGVPALYDNVMAVSCTDANDARCGFSNSGPEVDIAAPGFDILSTCFGSDTEYCRKSGTSMSSPHVAGAAALVWSQHTGLTNAQLRSFLECSATDIGAPAVDNLYGWGLLNVKAAMDSAASLSCPTPPAPVIYSGNGGDTSAVIDWTLANNGGSPLTGFKVYRGTCSGCETLVATTGPSPYRFTDSGLTPATNYFYQVSAVNQYGGEGPKSNEFLVRTTNPPPPGNAGSMSCYPAQGSASNYYQGTSSYSGHVVLTARGTFNTGNGANCVFEIVVPPRSGSDYSIYNVASSPCSAAKGSSCVASASFDWSRSSGTACAKTPYQLKVNGSVVASGTAQICDPPLWGYLPPL